MTPKLPSKKAVTIFLVVFIGVCCSSIAALFLLPQEHTTQRRVAIVLAFGTGFPLIVHAGLYLLAKTGIWNGK
jgi:hypothetical protein